MVKVFSRTSSCGLKVMYAALQILSEQDGSARVAALRSAIAQRVELSGWEMELVNGSPRWFTFLSFLHHLFGRRLHPQIPWHLVSHR